MIISIKHSSTYTYSKHVFVEPHLLYFTPAFRIHQKIRQNQINVSPDPSGMSQGIDIEGNGFQQIWFNDLLDTFTVQTKLEVESTEYDPFSFLPQSLESWEAPFMVYLKSIPIRKDISAWYAQARADQSINFLINLNQLVNARFEHESRYTEDILTPEVCFDSKQGSCRDLSYLMIQILRAENIPARFVSGYAFNSELKAGHELHAWVEAYIPGGGWVGADPSAGVLTTNQYIPICASYDPKKTLPIQGSYRGDATSDLSTEVFIKEIFDPIN